MEMSGVNSVGTVTHFIPVQGHWGCSYSYYSFSIMEVWQTLASKLWTLPLYGQETEGIEATTNLPKLTQHLNNSAEITGNFRVWASLCEAARSASWSLQYQPLGEWDNTVVSLKWALVTPWVQVLPGLHRKTLSPTNNKEQEQDSNSKPEILLQLTAERNDLFLQCWGPNSGLRACWKTTLPVERHPQTLVCFCFVL